MKTSSNREIREMLDFIRRITELLKNNLGT